MKYTGCVILWLATDMPLSVRYRFSQRFRVPAQKAFAWCTSFDPQDHTLMGEKGAERRITLVTIGTLILQDTFPSKAGKVEKQKLVQIYPEKLSWVSTHLSGPNQYSQFLYQISPRGNSASILEFTGLHLDYEGKEDTQSLAKRLREEDSAAWKLLAKAMAAEVGKKK